MDAPVTGPAQIPATVEVICGTLRGTYDVAKTKILYLSQHGGIREATPTEFERLGGRQATKKWKQSIRVVDSNGQAGKSLGEWLAGTAGTAGEGQRHALAWLSLGQRNGGGSAEGGEGGRGSQQQLQPQQDSAHVRELFLQQLLDFLSGRIDNPGAGPGSLQAAGGELGPVTMGSHSFDLRRVYTVVSGMGGYTAVQAAQNGWEKVAAALGLETAKPNGACACRSVYEHYLLRAERLEKAREAAGLPPFPPPPSRHESPGSPSGSEQSPPARGGHHAHPLSLQVHHHQQQQHQHLDRYAVSERPAVSQQRTHSPGPPPPYASRRAPPPMAPAAALQWTGSSRSAGGGFGGSGGHDRRSLDDMRYSSGVSGYGGRSPYGAGNGGGGRNADRYDPFLGGDGSGVYDGPSRPMYDAPPGRGGGGGSMYDRGPAGRGHYDGPGRDGPYDGPDRGRGYDGLPLVRREGYDVMGGRGGYDAGVRRQYDNGNGSRGGGGYYDNGDREGYDLGRRVVDLASREPYEDRGPGVPGGGHRYHLDDAPPLLDRRLTSFEALALLQSAHALQERRYDNSYEHRPPPLLPADVSEEQLMLAAGLRLPVGGVTRDGGGPIANPLLLDAAPSLAAIGRLQQPPPPPLRLVEGEGPSLQLHLGGMGGGTRSQQQHQHHGLRDAAPHAAGPSGGLGGRGSLLQAQLLERGGLVNLSGGLASGSGRVLPVTLALDAGAGAGAGVTLNGGGGGGAVRGRPPAGRTAGGPSQQLAAARAAAILGLQGGLSEAAVADESVITSLLNDYGRAGLPMGLVRTSSGNIGVSGIGLGLGGAGYKRGEPDDRNGSDAGDYGGGPLKRPAV